MNKFSLSILLALSFGFFFPLHAQTSPAFILSSDTGCVPYSASFTNQIPSNSNPLITYHWDFGNGDTSTLENPASVLYVSTGMYIINYTAFFDTLGFSLDSVIVTGSDCNDDNPPFTTNAPDLYMIVYDATMTQIYNNDPNIQPVVGTPIDRYPPVNVSTAPVLLTAQTYTLQIWDDDNRESNPDDSCGSFSFVPNDSTLSITNGVYSVTLYFTHTIDTLSYSDTLTVDACTGIESYVNANPSINVMPNPSTGECVITVPASGTYYITNQIGQIIRTDVVNSGVYQYKIDLPENGIYFVFGEDASTPARIVINK